MPAKMWVLYTRIAIRMTLCILNDFVVECRNIRNITQIYRQTDSIWQLLNPICDHVMEFSCRILNFVYKVQHLNFRLGIQTKEHCTNKKCTLFYISFGEFKQSNLRSFFAKSVTKMVVFLQLAAEKKTQFWVRLEFFLVLLM